MKTDKQLRAHICALFTACIWGTTFIASKILLQHFSVFDVLFYRFAIGYIALTIISPKPLKVESIKKELAMAVAGFFGITLYFLGENQALTFTATANVGVVVSLAPMFTVLLAYFFLKEEKPKWQFFLGFVVAMSGITLISFRGESSVSFHALGDFLALLAALFWAIYTVVLRKYVPMEKNMLAITKRIIFYGLITMIPCSLFFGMPVNPMEFFNETYLIPIMFLGVGASAICYLTWNWTLHTLGALKASNYIYAVPVITIIASAIILKETVTLTVVIGALLAIAGLIISEKNKS